MVQPPAEVSNASVTYLFLTLGIVGLFYLMKTFGVMAKDDAL